MMEEGRTLCEPPRACHPCSSRRSSQAPATGARASRPQFTHGANPVLRWGFDTVALHTDRAGNRMVHKGRNRDRLDGALPAPWRFPGPLGRRGEYPWQRRVVAV